MTEVNNDTPADEMVEVTSIPQFAAMVEAWHENVCAQLNQGINVPDDVVIAFGIFDGAPEVDLNEDQRLGFKAGLVMALSLFEQLPFAPMAVEEVPATQAGDEEGTGQ